jgi:hypothetical protein
MTFSSKQKFSLDLVQCKYEKEIEKKLKKKKAPNQNDFIDFLFFTNLLNLYC